MSPRSRLRALPSTILRAHNPAKCLPRRVGAASRCHWSKARQRHRLPREDTMTIRHPATTLFASIVLASVGNPAVAQDSRNPAQNPIK